MPFDPHEQPVRLTDFSLTDPQTFTGSDIRALVVRPQDDPELDRVIQFLEAVEDHLANEGTPEDSLGNIDESTLFLDPEFYKPDLARAADFVELFNLQSLTVSTFRNKAQVRGLGTINPRGFARGSRTSAGTLILTEFERDAWWELIGLPKEPTPSADLNIGDAGRSVLVDQIAPFDLVLIFNNELGAAAYRYIYGVDIITNGIVYSISDLYHENTISFVCRDVTPLTPVEEIKDIIRKQARNPHGRHRRISTLNYVESGREITRRFRLRKASRDPFR